MKHKAEIIVSGFMIAVIAMMIMPLNAVIAQLTTNETQTTTTTNETKTTTTNANQTVNNNNNLPTKVFQDDKQIIFTVTKNGEPLPPGPIIIVPPPEGGSNGTIITPGENKSNEGNTTVVEPNGNVTEIPNSNVTQVDNNTVVVVSPPDRNVTETPGNVTVIDPVVGNGTVTKPCTCNQTQPTNTIPSVTVIPAPGQNVTTQLPQNQPVPVPIPLPPVENTTNPNPPVSNNTGPLPPFNNQTSNNTGNIVPALR